jgi:hypothetical protein
MSFTSAGTISSLLEHQSRDLSFIDLVSRGLEALDKMGTHWNTAEQQLKQAKPRISTVMAHTTSGTSSGKAAFFIPKTSEQSLWVGLRRHLWYLEDSVFAGAWVWRQG